MSAKNKKTSISMSSYINFAIFALLMIGIGVSRIYTYYHTTEPDPIRQLIYPLIYMPVASFIYGILEGLKRPIFSEYRYIPIVSAIMAIILYFFAENGGFTFNFSSLLSSRFYIVVPFPSFISALFGTITGKVIFLTIQTIHEIKLFKRKNTKK